MQVAVHGRYSRGAWWSSRWCTAVILIHAQWWSLVMQRDIHAFIHLLKTYLALVYTVGATNTGYKCVPGLTRQRCLRLVVQGLVSQRTMPYHDQRPRSVLLVVVSGNSMSRRLSALAWIDGMPVGPLVSSPAATSSPRCPFPQNISMGACPCRVWAAACLWCEGARDGGAEEDGDARGWGPGGSGRCERWVRREREVRVMRVQGAEGAGSVKGGARSCSVTEGRHGLGVWIHQRSPCRARHVPLWVAKVKTRSMEPLGAAATGSAADCTSHDTHLLAPALAHIHLLAGGGSGLHSLRQQRLGLYIAPPAWAPRPPVAGRPLSACDTIATRGDSNGLASTSPPGTCPTTTAKRGGALLVLP